MPFGRVEIWVSSEGSRDSGSTIASWRDRGAVMRDRCGVWWRGRRDGRARNTRRFKIVLRIVVEDQRFSGTSFGPKFQTGPAILRTRTAPIGRECQVTKLVVSTSIGMLMHFCNFR